jgi:hypothetical protein
MRAGPRGIIIRGPPVPPAVDDAPAGAEAAAAAEADAAGAVPGTAHVTFANRVALWKLPCPRMGDHATPAFCFIA